MSGDETLQKRHEESESESEDEQDAIPQIDIDASKLTPLSPEVISKQVGVSSEPQKAVYLIFHCRPRSTWVCNLCHAPGQAILI